jgi:hypothetical protein
MSMRRLHRRLALAAVLLVGSLLVPSTAGADIGETIILRCTHGESLGGFSQSAYQQALKELSADAEEYTNCASLIRQAQLSAAGGGPPVSGESPAPLATSPSERRSLARAAHIGSAPVNLGGQIVHPGVIHADVASAFSSLPGPLLATLAFLLACLIIVAAGAVRKRIRGRSAD